MKLAASSEDGETNVFHNTKEANNNNQVEYPKFTYEVEPPWRVSQKGSVWCRWQNIPNDIRSQLTMENRFEKTIDYVSYHVKRNEDGSYVVFRNTPRNQRGESTKTAVYRVSEIQILPVEEANKLLASSGDQFEPIGTDPIKVINQQFFVALGKKKLDREVP